MTSNFKFMEVYWPEMAQLGAAAESYLYSDPNACIFKLGLLGERLVSELLAYEHISVGEEATHADRVIVMKEGAVVMDGTPEEIFRDGDAVARNDLELPVADALAADLIAAGFPLEKTIYSESALAEAICRSK